MLMKCPLLQKRVIWLLLSACELECHSISNLDCLKVDILIWLVEVWSLKLQLIQEQHNPGTLIGKQRPSRTGRTEDGHSISTLLVELIDFKLGIPTLDGGKSSNTMLDQKCSPTSRITRLLMFLEAEIKKVTVFKSGERTTLLHRSGRLCI